MKITNEYLINNIQNCADTIAASFAQLLEMCEDKDEAYFEINNCLKTIEDAKSNSINKNN